VKLLYDIPEPTLEALKLDASVERILYCVPANVSTGGSLVDGFSVVTNKRFIAVDSEREIVSSPIDAECEFKAVALVGNGVLELKRNGRASTLARFTVDHMPRYSTLSRALKQLAGSETPRFLSTHDEGLCTNCGRALPPGTNVCPHCVSVFSVSKRLLSSLRPHWRLLIAVLTIFILSSGTALIGPQLLRMLIDGYLVPMNRDLMGMLIIVAAIGVTYLAETILFGALQHRVTAKIGELVSKDLRAMVFAKVQALSLTFLQKRKTGDLMNRINNDTNQIRRFLSGAAARGVVHLITVLGIGTILVLRDWRLALLVLLPTPAVVVFIRVGWSFVRHLYRKQWQLMDRVDSLLQDVLSGIRVVKAFGREEWEVDRFKQGSADVRDMTTRTERAWFTITPISGFVLGIGYFLVFYYGGHLVLGERMAIGELVQFSVYAAMLYGPLAWMSAIPKMFIEAMVAAERVFEIVDEDPAIKDHKRAKTKQISGRVVFDSVVFGYLSHEPVLDNVSMEIEPGELVGLAGHSGAGKTTITNLLLRLYDVDEGAILIDGTDIRDIPLRDLRSQIGVVLQETFLFSGSVVDNIRYSKQEASLEEVIEAAKIAQAHDFITHFPDGYDTRVGEYGQRLAGGERQRVAIARAILHDPRILILDEATSSVDTETEQKIQQALSALIVGRTTFAIAHRLSTLRHANRLLVLEDGKRAEMGTHRELMDRKGIYYNLVRAQRQMARAKGVAG
jgi:ATP-binding cassette subfamily B protein